MTKRADLVARKTLMTRHTANVLLLDNVTLSRGPVLEFLGASITVELVVAMRNHWWCSGNGRCGTCRCQCGHSYKYCTEMCSNEILRTISFTL